MPGHHLADLWSAIIMGFKPSVTVPFPLVGDIQEIYNRLNLKEVPSGFKKSALDRGETMPTGDIANKVNSLRLKDNPSMDEIDFIEAWEMLAYHWGRIKDETGDEYRAHQYCDEVKRSLLRGDEVKHTDGAYERVAEIFGKEDSRK